jgi:uncharacterized protein YndB with AHSA1/START domain
MCEDRIDQTVYIKSSREAVWRALTDPDVTQEYWGGTRLESDWTPGSELRYVRDGELTDRNQVLEAERPARLVHTFNPLQAPYAGEPPSRVAITLEQSGEVTRLTLEHDEFLPGSRVQLACSQGWPAILSSLKTLLETGAALPEVSFAT